MGSHHRAVEYRTECRPGGVESTAFGMDPTLLEEQPHPQLQ